MLSRVVDSIYWMSRSIERVENIARFIDVNLLVILDLPAGRFRNPAEQHLGQLRVELAYIGVQQILHQWLHEFLDALQTKLNLIGDGIFETCFALRPIGGTER